MDKLVLGEDEEEWPVSKTGEKLPLMEESPDIMLNLEVEEVQTRTKRKRTGYIYLLTLISALGGFLFGYDTGVVSGAILEIRSTFTLSPAWLEAVVSITIGFAAISSLVAGILCNWLGRKPVLQVASVVFTAGAVLMAVSFYPVVLLIGRAVTGVGIGLAAMAVPMYIAEMVPSDMRGMLVVLYAMFVTGGQFVATIVDGIFSYVSYDIGWRFMLGLAGVPSLLMFVGFLFMPESPRWLVFHGKNIKAKEVLLMIHPQDDVEAQYTEIRKDFQEHQRNKMGFWSLLEICLTSRSVLLALLVGCGLQVFQQLSGINTIMYYSASIIQMAGFSDRSSIWLATVPSSANFLFTIVGLLLVERLGRRKLLLLSSTGTILSLILLSGTFYGMNRFSPEATPINKNFCNFNRCGSCVGHSSCGFCVDYNSSSDSYLHGTCVPSKLLHNGTAVSGYELTGAPCPVVGIKVEEVSVFRHMTTDGSLEVDIYFPFPDNYRADYMYAMDPTLERVWLPYSCPDSKLTPLALLGMFLYIAFFAPGMGPLPWTVNTEIYPTWVRSTAISIATMMNWICNLVVSMTFLTMTDHLGQPWTFGLYAVLASLGLLFILLLVPETKGCDLEDVEKLFKKPHFMSWFRDSKVT